MTKAWSCECWQSRCRYSKVLEALWPVNQAQTTCNCESGAVVAAAPGWQVQWPVTGGRITSFIPVLVRGSVLKL